MKSRFLCILLVVCLFSMSISISVHAESGHIEGIIESLREIEPQKEYVGLGEVDFSELKIGEEIQVYDYTGEAFEESWIGFPLFNDNELVAIMFHVRDSHYQLMNGLAEQISLANCNSLAIVYDRNGCNIFDGEKMTLILETRLDNPEMGILPEESAEEYNDLKLADLTISSNLGYTASIQPRVQTTYSIGITPVYQQLTNICWAASTACISNYLKGTNLTSVKVAEDYYGRTTDLNYREAIENVYYYFREIFPNENYIYDGSVPSDSALLSNMMNSKPIYGSFRSTLTQYYHAVVVYGYSLNGYIWVMDPEFGNTMATKIHWSETETSYSYVSSTSGQELEFIRAICVYWN